MQATTTDPRSLPGRRIEIEGIVQGVGFRPWVYRLAREGGIAGRVRNDGRGVSIEAFAPEGALDLFVTQLQESPPPAAVIRRLRWHALAPRAVTGFTIVDTGRDGERRPSIPADLATCPDCLAELFDPHDRRHRYPFVNCTNCGPRFTISTDVPYDRAATTMARFRMCPDCQREYDDPRDRRFHAQPNACPVCGPRLRLLDARGDVVRCDDPLQVAVAALRAGMTVAIKGLGGFHLACDATSEDAVRTLRERKRRSAKPFAVMVRDLPQARALAELQVPEERLLAGVERPIVVAPRRDAALWPAMAKAAGGARLAPSVAPGVDLVGVMLPYTPLHHLLLADFGRPLVMTSANLAEEPLVWRDEEAVERLAGIADLFLTHDREIAAPCEDSVVRTVAGAPTIVRRSRGFVPRPLPVAVPFAAPVLAIGGDLKSVACLGVGDTAWLTPHVGDLESPAGLDALALAVERLQRFVGARAEVIAHDPHPGYHSRRLALELPARRHLAVQHHHAHVASCLCEHGLEGPALGLVFDGTGWGPSPAGKTGVPHPPPGTSAASFARAIHPLGNAWGGELLRADLRGYERLATLRPLRLPGGETALREIWRLALAALDDAFDGEPPVSALLLFRQLRQERVEAVRRQLAAGVNSPLAHGAGRWFDAIGALVLALAQSRYEGEAALRLERCAAAVWTAVPAYPFAFRADAAPWQIDLRPTVRAVVRELLVGRPAATIAARFHSTVASAGESMVRHAIERNGTLPVVLSGGCFQNPLLVSAVETRLADLRVHRHRLVPPGDGGLALGQAAVAAALARCGDADEAMVMVGAGAANARRGGA
jgi:hydrogenase maturation protein HypF